MSQYQDYVEKAFRDEPLAHEECMAVLDTADERFIPYQSLASPFETV